MAHPLIEHAERTLVETGFTVQRVAGAPQLPGEQLLVSVSNDPQGRERLILLTLYEGLSDEIDDAHLLQYFVRFPFEVAPEHRDDLARFLNLVNVRLPLGAYGFLYNGMVFFRAMAMLTVDTATWSKLISEYLFITVFALDAFAEGVEAVATGHMTAQQASEADARLDPLDA
jgi:hypothetical protein